MLAPETIESPIEAQNVDKSRKKTSNHSIKKGRVKKLNKKDDIKLGKVVHRPIAPSYELARTIAHRFYHEPKKKLRREAVDGRREG